MQVKHISRDRVCMCDMCVCNLSFNTKPFSFFTAHLQIRGTDTHTQQAENKTKCPHFSSYCQEPLHKPHCISQPQGSHITAANTCCWHILRLTLAKKTAGLSAPDSQFCFALFFFCFNYLLVLFIAELFSSAALLLHWWSAKASERVPTAPWLTPLLLLLLLLCVLYVFMRPGQQERAQDGELLGLRAAHLPVIDLTKLHS